MKNYLRNIFLLAALFAAQLARADVAINATNFPDALFREFVNDNYAGGDNVLTDDERNSVEYFGILYSEVKNMKGIEFFPNITRLDVYGCQLTTIDISKNTKLQELHAAENLGLKTITWGSNKANFTSIDLSETAITAFDLSGFTNLYSLNLRNVTTWGKTITVSGLTQLSWLYLEGSSIETLVAHQTPNLSYDSGWPVKYLDFSNKGWTNANIYSPQVWDEATQSYVNSDCPLETIILSGNMELTGISIDHFKNLKTIKLDGCDQLNYISIKYNDALTALDLTQNPALSQVEICYNPQLTQVTWGDPSTVTHMNIRDSQLASFDLSGFINLKELNLENCAAWGKTLNVSGMTQLSSLYLEGSTIETLVAQQTPYLYFDPSWPVKTLDFSNKGWDWGSFYGPQYWDEASQSYINADCPLETLILSGNKDVTAWEIHNFKNLKTIDLKNCEQLSSVYINNNDALASLDLSGHPALQSITLHNNPKLKQATWGDPTTITYMDFEDSQLTSFDLSGFTNLENLNLRNCTAWGTTLDVSGLPQLSTLYFDGSTIETLVAHQTPNLGYNTTWTAKTVDFSNKGWPEGYGYSIYGPEKWVEEINSWVNDDCPLESLDLSGNQTLTNIEIRSFKNLKNINLDGATALTSFAVHDNDVLANLDLSPVTALSNLYCYNNALLNLDLSQNKQMNDWEDNDKPQHPKMELVTISSGKVGLLVPEDFNVSKVTNLKANGTACTPAISTISGKRFLTVSTNAASAATLKGKKVTYEYGLGWSNETMKVEGDVTQTGKCFTKLSLSSTSVSGTYGQAAPTAPTVTTSEFYDGTISYTSDKETVVKVAADGKLTIVGAGTAKVTVQGAETQWRQATNAATYTVTIAKASPKLQFAKTALEMTIQDAVPTNTLSRGVYDGTVTFTSSNTNIATVASDGKVTVKAAGTVTITASAPATANCNKPANVSYTLTINKKTAAINIASATVNGTWGQSITAPTVTTTNSYDGTLSYASSNKNVVTVAANGKLTVVGAGTATITVTATETAIFNAPTKATYKVVIAKATPVFKFEKDKIVAQEGYTQNKLSTGIYDGTVTYSSSDSKIAAVDPQTGEITFLDLGTVTITAQGPATTNCNAVSASYQLQVTLAVGIEQKKATFDDIHYYTVDGIAVEHPVKGRIYIKNGKKVLYK